MENNNDVRLLQVGDVVYGVTHYGVSKKHVVERVSDKQAFCNGGIKCLREVKKGSVKMIGYSSFIVMSFYLETEELKNKYTRKTNLEKIKEFAFDRLSDVDVQRVFDILTSSILGKK